jgi:hypothetical protein
MSPEQRLREIMQEHGLAPAGCTIAASKRLEPNEVILIAGIRYVVRREIGAEEFRQRCAANAERRARQARSLGFPTCERASSLWR